MLCYPSRATPDTYMNESTLDANNTWLLWGESGWNWSDSSDQIWTIGCRWMSNRWAWRQIYVSTCSIRCAASRGFWCCGCHQAHCVIVLSVCTCTNLSAFKHPRGCAVYAPVPVSERMCRCEPAEIANRLAGRQSTSGWSKRVSDQANLPHFLQFRVQHAQVAVAWDVAAASAAAGAADERAHTQHFGGRWLSTPESGPRACVSTRVRSLPYR